MHALLGIDLGTTGIKAALFAAEDGHVLSSSFVEYPLLHPQPGWAEQHPADWWQATVAAIRTCLAQAALRDVQPADVQGIGLSGQMRGVVLLDEENQVLRPCIIWADQRSEAQCRWMTERAGAERLVTYVSNPALPGFSAPKALWVCDNEPEIFARTRTIILPKDYIRYRLTGVLAMEISDAAGTCLLNVKEGPAFGAALLAGVASGAYHSIQQACDSMVRLVEHTKPRPEIEQVYARRYETYRALYPALKPILSSPS